MSRRLQPGQPACGTGDYPHGNAPIAHNDGMNTPATPPRQLAVPVDTLDHVLGAAAGAPVVLEYGDFECPSCAQAYPAVKMLMQRFQHRFRFVFRHFPVPEAHPHAVLAAEAAEAAGAQGRFWEMHDLLFENPQHMAAADLQRHAQRLGLDMPRFDAELADHVYLQRVQEHIASGRACHLRATPGFFVDGAVVDTSFGMQALADAIERRLAV
jgi:protein-disulfide isomerase